MTIEQGAGSGQRPNYGDAYEQRRDGQQHRGDDVEPKGGVIAPLPHQRRIQAKSGKGRESAKETRREEQPELLTAAALHQEKFCQDTHQKSANDIYEQCSVGKVRAEIGKRSAIDAMAERRPKPATSKHDQISTDHFGTVAPTPYVRNGVKRAWSAPNVVASEICYVCASADSIASFSSVDVKGLAMKG